MINNKIFGADIPLRVKKVLEARQFLAEQNYPEGTSIIFNNYDGSKTKIADLITSNLNPNPNQYSVTDLSSRTPFARMWTAVQLLHLKAEDKELINPEDLKEEQGIKDGADIKAENLPKNIVLKRELKKGFYKGMAIQKLTPLPIRGINVIYPNLDIGVDINSMRSN